MIQVKAGATRVASICNCLDVDHRKSGQEMGQSIRFPSKNNPYTILVVGQFD